METATMPVHAKHFDREKALEVILYIAESLTAPTLHGISKILYLADKQHLQDFGRLICGDQYIAMEYGPVPSAIYDMMKVAAGRKSIDIDWDELINDAFKVTQGRNIKPIRRANTGFLAESETSCITQTIAAFGRKTFGELTDITHDAAWNEVGENQFIPIDAIAKTLPNANDVIAYLRAH